MRKVKADRIVYDVGQWVVVKGKKVWESRVVLGSRGIARAFKSADETIRRMEAFHVKTARD
jgi:hypothetical protein